MVAESSSTERSSDDLLALLGQRHDLLSALSNAPAERPELVETVDSSQATVYRAMKELTEAGIVTHGDDGYRLTTWGETVLGAYEAITAQVERLQQAQRMCNSLPGEATLPAALFRDATVVTADGPNPHAPGSRLGDLLLESDRIRALVKAHTQENAAEVLHRAIVDRETPTEFVCEDAFYDYLNQADDPTIERVMRDDRLTTFAVESVPFGLFLLDRADDPDLVTVVAYDDDGLLTGTVVTSAPDARDWGAGIYEHYKTRAKAPEADAD